MIENTIIKSTNIFKAQTMPMGKTLQRWDKGVFIDGFVLNGGLSMVVEVPQRGILSDRSKVRITGCDKFCNSSSDF